MASATPTIKLYLKPGRLSDILALIQILAYDKIDLAIQLHDREVQRRDRWKTVIVPMVVAIIAAGTSIVGAIISTTKDESVKKETISEPTNHSISTQNQEDLEPELPAPEKQKKIIEKKKIEEDSNSSNSKTAPNKPIQPTPKSG